MAELSGRIVHRGQPLADCQVLAIDETVLAAFLARDLTRWAQAGRWWITAHHSVSYSARPIDAPDPVSWVAVAAVTADGRQLPARDRGFELDVTGPTDVTIQLAPTPNR